MKDKLIIIATIQYLIENIKTLIGDPATLRSREKLGCLKALSLTLVQIHFAITGNHWSGSPQDLTIWMIRYIKAEADALGERNLVTIQ